VLVCLQLSTAAYACPANAGSQSTPMVAMAGMTDCDQMTSMDAERPQLCKAHCDRDKQTVNNVPAPDMAPTVILDRLLTRLALWLERQAAEALPAVITAHTGPPEGTPPVYLALQVFRN
jgi:hypothetical protein